MMTTPVPVDTYDIIWGQGSWNHVLDKAELLKRWVRTLTSKGRYAVEDCWIEKPASKINEVQLLKELAKIWRAYFTPADTWLTIFRELGLKASVEDLRRPLVQYCREMNSLLPASGAFPADEIRAYQLCEQLVESGIIGYFRIVAVQE